MSNAVVVVLQLKNVDFQHHARNSSVYDAYLGSENIKMIELCMKEYDT